MKEKSVQLPEMTDLVRLYQEAVKNDWKSAATAAGEALRAHTEAEEAIAKVAILAKAAVERG